jgi:hypothetical protein
MPREQTKFIETFINHHLPKGYLPLERSKQATNVADKRVTIGGELELAGQVRNSALAY